MSPQLVDFNADGTLDMVMGTFEGVAFLVPGTEEGFGEPEYVLDAEGRAILISMVWTRPQGQWEKLDRSPAGESHPQDHGISTVALDWDADGDLDLLLGAKEGGMYLRMNEGTREEPSYALTNQRVLVDDEPLMVPGGLTAPRVVDWDGDGLFDLVCGSFTGGAYLYENLGEAGAPAFGEPITLLRPGSKGMMRDEPGPPCSGSYVDAVDYDGDGDLDLLVGGKSEWETPPRELSAAEAARVTELQAELDALNKRISALRDSAPMKDSTEYEAWRAKYDPVRNAARAVKRELSPLVEGPKVGEFVWLYRREG